MFKHFVVGSKFKWSKKFGGKSLARTHTADHVTHRGPKQSASPQQWHAP